MMNKIISGIVCSLLPILLFAAVISGQEAASSFSFGVLDKNSGFYDGLKPADVRLLVNKRPVPITTLTLRAARPLEVLILIDASASQERTLPDERKAAELFIDSVLEKGKDKVAAAKFSGDIYLVQDMTGNFEEAKAQVRKIEFEPPPGYVLGGVMVGLPKPDTEQAAMGSTSVFDSVSKASDALAAAKSDSRKAVLLISDGVNTYGEGKLTGVIKNAIGNQVPVHTIGMGDDAYTGVDRKTLKKLSEGTGGISVVPGKKLADLDPLLKRIGQGLRSEYKISFAPASPGKKGELQEIEIEIVNPELQKLNLQIIRPKGYLTK
jgi:VWFA-related protein